MDPILYLALRFAPGFASPLFGIFTTLVIAALVVRAPPHHRRMRHGFTVHIIHASCKALEHRR
ncbi:MAG: hypothetical protein ABSF69_29090 [Polyangiaceae bacterium]